MRFSPSCNCCGECNPTERDDFNRNGAVGADWTVLNGSWSCNGSALQGSGLIHHTTFIDKGAMKLKINSGTVKCCLFSDVIFDTVYDYVQIGDGSISWYGDDGIGGHGLIKSVAGPSTGEFQLCVNRGAGNAAGGVGFKTCSVTGPGFYETADMATGAAGVSEYHNAGVGGDSTVVVDWVELLDREECCPGCPACKKRDVGENGLVLDWGDREAFTCGADTFSGEILLDRSPGGTALSYPCLWSEDNSGQLFCRLGGDEENGDDDSTNIEVYGPEITPDSKPYQGSFLEKCDSFEVELTWQPNVNSCVLDSDPITIRTVD